MNGPPVTLKGLQKHYRKYGCEKKKDGFGKYHDKEYRSWKQLRKDALIEVAMEARLPTNEILLLVGEMTGNNEKVINDAAAELEGDNE